MVAAPYDPHSVERKWQGVWEEKGVYRAWMAPARPKFFVTVPYPYVNGYPHLGYATSFLRAEFLARYKRMTGYNVLFPQGFHCTGLPILGAAKRIAEKEPVQVQILLDMGIPAAEIAAFADPHHWIEVFPKATMVDLKAVGAAVDWSRTFITTPLNPPYDAFVRWQFRRLRERGYVQMGRHELIWCPRDEAPIGDHDRLEGEGVQPAAFTLLKFPFANLFLVAATLRPETVFGQTNLWVDPDATYLKAEVDGETWVVNREAVHKLGQQGRKVRVLGEVAGRDLVGREVLAPGIDRAIPVFPSKFLEQGRGTGIVTSVPSDAPDDWMALRDLQGDEAHVRAVGLDPARVAGVKPIPIIRSEGWGPLPAVEICERLGVRDQLDREKLEAAKAEIYRTGFYTGVMTEAAGEFAGMRVEEAKEKIRARLLETGAASVLWEPAEEVVCRCATRAIVKIVDDQWVLSYGDPAWKKAAHDALNQMVFFPEVVRKQLHWTVDWLRDWACAHHRGLGTKLPWDEHWVIESLSDSTVYMAYYTIAHALQEGKLRSEVPWASQLTDAVFDYVVHGSGDAAGVAEATGADPKLVEALRKEFVYWYPVDLRNTGKDLIQNHMTFCVFNHVALFPRELGPRSFGFNGYVRLGGQKMSKSKGNVWYLRAAVEEWGADVVRMIVANAGDGVDDPRLDLGFAEAARDRLVSWFEDATAPAATTDEVHSLDPWLVSSMNRAVAAVREAMESLEYRPALRAGFFDLQSAWDWYVRRVRVPNRGMRDRFIETQTILLTPFAPHICEEIWQRLGKSDFIVTVQIPSVRGSELSEAAEAAEALLRSGLEDAREILRVAGIANPRRVTFFVAPAWKREAVALAGSMAAAGALGITAFMERASSMERLKPHAKELAGFAKKLIEDIARHQIPASAAEVDEHEYLSGAREFLERELGCEVRVQGAEEPGLEDPRGKARHAAPGRPAIFVE